MGEGQTDSNNVLREASVKGPLQLGSFCECVIKIALGVSGEESTCNARDTGDSGSVPGEGNDNSLQYSCLENPMDRGAWRATVHRVAKSETQLSTEASKLTKFNWCAASLLWFLSKFIVAIEIKVAVGFVQLSPYLEKIILKILTKGIYIEQTAGGYILNACQFFKLACNCFTTLCWFLLHNNGESAICIHIPPRS